LRIAFEPIGYSCAVILILGWARADDDDDDNELT